MARFLPPLILTEDLAQKSLKIFADSLKDIEKSRQTDGLALKIRIRAEIIPDENLTHF